LSSRLILEWS